MSRSSWTATAAGRWAAVCRVSPDTGRAPRRCGAMVECAPGSGVSVLTVYAFSSDNWKRPPLEVAALMSAARGCYLVSETPRCAANGVKMSIIGRRDRLPDSLRASISEAERETALCGELELRLAIDYSARDAILDASRRAAGACATREDFEVLLGESRPVDILIRTGGEQRLSDFLLWECAYAELIFIDSYVARLHAARSGACCRAVRAARETIRRGPAGAAGHARSLAAVTPQAEACGTMG